MLGFIFHYGLHFLVFPILAYAIWEYKANCGRKAFFLVLLTMIVDLDHLLATPIFDADRLSIGFHPLHSYLMIVIYIIALIYPYPYGRYWWLRVIAFGLVGHMMTDYLDYHLF